MTGHLSNTNEWLSDNVLGGIGSAGPGFNQFLWREVGFFLEFVLAFQKLELSKRKSLLADSWSSRSG